MQLIQLPPRPAPTPENSFYLMRIMTLGNVGVGKSTFVQNYLGDVLEDPDFMDVTYKDFWGAGGKTRIKVEVDDVPKSNQLFKQNNQFWRNKTAAFIMFDVTNAKSFHHTTGSYNGGVEVWLSNLKCSSYMHEGMVKFLIGLHRNNGRRQVKFEEAQSFARDNELTYVEVDPTDHCHTNYIIKLCVEKIIERVDSGFYGDPPRFDRYGIKILGSKELADTGPIMGQKVTPFGYDSPDEEEVEEEPDPAPPVEEEEEE